jgi:hypothetical protein
MTPKDHTSGEVILLNPTKPEAGEPHFTIRSAGFTGPWKAGETIRIPPPKQRSIIKALKAMAVLTMLVPAVWLMAGMVLSAILTP